MEQTIRCLHCKTAKLQNCKTAKLRACQKTNRQCFADSSFFRNWSRHSVPSFQFIHFNLIPLLVHARVLCNLGTSEVEHGH